MQSFKDREDWVEDNDAKDCQKCKKPFILIVRRRHHCRGCGKVFCDDCSNNFLDSHLFQGVKNNKKLRFCGSCYADYKSRIYGGSKTDDNTAGSSTRGGSNLQDLARLEQETREYVTNRLKSDNESDSIPEATLQENPLTDSEDLTKQLSALRLDLEQRLTTLVELETQNVGIHQTWFQIVNTYVKQAIHDIQLKPGESMQIEDYVTITEIPFQNYSATSYMRGVVLMKNVASKKMAMSQRNPSVLLIKGNLEGDSMEFDQIQKKESRIKNNALQLLDLLQPKLILSESKISIQLLDDLHNRGITAAINFDEDQLQFIAEAVGARVVKAADFYSKKVDSSCLGKCERVIFKNFDANSIKRDQLSPEEAKVLSTYLEDIKLKDTTLLFIYAPQCINKVSITLSGPQILELKKVKSTILQLLQIAVGMYLEKEIIGVDFRFKYKMFRNFKNPLITCGDFNDFLFQGMSFQEIDKLNRMELVKAKYVSADITKIHDIQIDNYSALNQYIRENKENFNNKKIFHFCQLCQVYEDDKIRFFYNKGDISLGKYITEKCHQEFPCQDCKRKRNKHITIFYGPECFVKMEVQSKEQKVKLKVMQQKLEQSEITMIEESAYISQDFLNEEADEQKIEPEHHNNYIVDTYLQCVDCEQKLTEQIRLNRTHLAYSFHRFLQNFLVNTYRHYQKDQSKEWLSNPVYQELATGNCGHQHIQRVFVHDSIKVKFYSNIFYIYSVELIDFGTEEIKQQTIAYDQQFCMKRRDTLYEKILNVVQLFQSWIDIACKEKNKQSPSSAQQLDLNNEAYQKVNEHLKSLRMLVEQNKQIQYKDFLSLEYESIRLYSKFAEFHKEVKRKLNIDDHPKSISKILQGNLVEQQEEKQAVQERPRQVSPRPAQDNMLALLINPKQIEKELRRQNQKKNLDLIKRSQQLQKQQQIRRSSIRAEIRGGGESFRAESPENETIKQQSPEFEVNDLFYLSMDLLRKEWPSLPLNISEATQQVGSQNPIYPYIPIFNSGDISIIAYGLNGPQYQAMYNRSDFRQMLEQKYLQQEYAKRLLTQHRPSDSDDYLEIRVTVEKKRKVKEPAYDMQKSPPSPFMPEDEAQSVRVMEMNGDAQQFSNIQASTGRSNMILNNNLIVYYPKQFECLRIINSIPLERFIKSLASCASWDSSGGKSGSTFFKSADNLFVFKGVKDSEFYMFDEFAPKYFKYMYDVIYEKKPSVLNKIYGMFELQHPKGKQYIIAMENLFYGLQDDILVYDLKGSEAKRWNRKNGKTLLDTNFLIDRNGEPLPLLKQHYTMIKKALEFDSEFLEQVNVVDYSLLLIIEKQKKKVKMGIIDYLQQFNLKKNLENRFKTVINLGFDPTIVKPPQYKSRFMSAMHKYFMGINSTF